MPEKCICGQSISFERTGAGNFRCPNCLRVYGKDGKELSGHVPGRGVRVGPFYIAALQNGHLHITHEGGEGGGFTQEQLIPYLRQFWKEQF